MKKLLLILLLPFAIKGQITYSTLMNIYPTTVTPLNYQLQPGPGTNNNTLTANYNDNLTAVIYLQWSTNPPTAANYFGVSINNNYAPCMFTYTNTGGLFSYTSLTQISTTPSGAYYKFNFTLNGFNACTNPAGYGAYQMKIGGTANPGLNPSFQFTVYPLSTSVEEVDKPNKIIRTESYNILGQPCEDGFILVQYFENGDIKKRKEFH